jgi:hypothetical protein
MKLGKRFLLSCTAIVLSSGIAQAGPCNTAGRDAGSGPTPGHTTQTTGAASPRSDEHPPTSTMNKAAGDLATSSQDAQRQMQGQPTVAQEARGQTPRSTDNGC